MAIPVEILLRQKGGEDVSKAVKKLQSDFDNAGKAIDKSIQQAAGLKRELKDIGNALDTVETAAIKKLDEQLDATRESADKAAKSIREVREEAEKPIRAKSTVEKPGISAAELRRRQAFEISDPVGDVDTGVAAFAGAFGQFGGAGVEQVARGVSDVLAISEAAPRIVASLATVSAGMVATAGVLGAGALAFYALNKAIQAGEKQAVETAETYRRIAEAEKQTREDLQNLGLGDAEQQSRDLQASLQADIRSRDAYIQKQVAQIAEIDSNSDAFLTGLSGITTALGGSSGVIGKTKEEVEKYNKAIQEQEAELRRINEQVLPILRAQEAGATAASSFAGSLERRIQLEKEAAIATETYSSETAQSRVQSLEIELAAQQEYYDALKAETDRAFDDLEAAVLSGASQEDIAKLQARAEGLQNSLNETYAPLQATIDQIDLFNSKIIPQIEAREREIQAIERATALQEQAAQQADRAASGLEKMKNAQQALADFEGQLALDELNKRREASINAVYDGQLKAIDADIARAKAAEKAQQAQQKLTQLETTRAEKIRSTNQQFYEQELTRLADFRKEEQRINDDFAREQRRRLEDLNDELTEAVADNDVVAFIRAQREGSKELSRAAEDFSVDAAQRTEDFNTETQRNQQEHVRALLDINREYQEQRIQLQAQGDTTELSILDQLQQRRAEIVAQREASLEQFRQQLENEAINRRRQSFLRQYEIARQEYEALNKLAFSAIATAISASAAALTSSIKVRLPSFADGAESITRPMAAIVGDMKPPFDAEAIIPYRRSDGYGLPGGGRGAGIVNNFDFSGTNFGNLSRSEVVSIVDGSVNSAMWKLTGIVEGHAS